MKKLFVLLALLFAHSLGYTASASFTAMSTTAAPIPNPDRGWAGWSGSDFVTNYDSASVTSGYNSGERLSFCLMNIGSFRGTTISAGWLTDFQTRLNSIRSAGMKCVINIAYDYSAGGNDDTASNIAGHLAQMAPVFKANEDVIAYFKATFVGAWGEWHSSSHGNSCGYNSGGTSCSTANANRLTVRNALMANVPRGLQIQFRYPDDMIQWFPTVLTASGAFTGSTQSRIGFHDDCQLSYLNTGTYNSNSSGSSTSTLIAYAEAMTRYTPYGGELASNCATPHKITCAEARAEFSAKHLAWLKNSGTDDDEWTYGWASGGCTNEITNLMGYRIRYDSLTHADTVTAGATLDIALKLRNVGWSRIFREQHVTGKLVKSGATDIACESGADLRLLPQQATSSTQISMKCVVPGGATLGAYTLHLRMPDPFNPTTRNYMIRPANTDSGSQVWNNTTGYFTTGTSVTVN